MECCGFIDSWPPEMHFGKWWVEMSKQVSKQFKKSLSAHNFERPGKYQRLERWSSKL